MIKIVHFKVSLQLLSFLFVLGQFDYSLSLCRLDHCIQFGRFVTKVPAIMKACIKDLFYLRNLNELVLIMKYSDRKQAVKKTPEFITFKNDLMVSKVYAKPFKTLQPLAQVEDL